ncbi:Matrilin-3 [Bagarius yarrelli]|uniref:Matrilin-3 n=1 Tax=Bagarius yarrelli TaxID=175774 RepID=A0A556V2H9_BAGYA|nr:Matrilin-3 [Bagarius yarrelli]
MGNDCEHICVSSGSSYYCKCERNYILNEDQRTCSLKRVSPCKIGHSCQQICVGSDMSYYCRCRPGYVLNEDKRTCSVSRDGDRDGHNDGEANGRNNSDIDGESSASIDVCALGHDCQHACVSNGSSYYCACPPGFVLMQDRKSCFKARVGDDDGGSTSLDQCGMGHDCEHICVSSDGSYRCECRQGFVLNEDKKTCSQMKVEVVQDPCHCEARLAFQRQTQNSIQVLNGKHILYARIKLSVVVWVKKWRNMETWTINKNKFNRMVFISD